MQYLFLAFAALAVAAFAPLKVTLSLVVCVAITTLAVKVSFVLGFKLALNAHFGASASIAVISTVVSAGCLFVLKPMLF